MSFADAEADRRLATLLQLGVVTAVDGGAGTVRVAIGDLNTHPIAVAQYRMGSIRIAAMPSVGEQVVIGAPGGDMARAVVIASLPASNAPSGDPENVLIDLGGAEMHVTGRIVVDGDVVASGISLTGHLHGGVTPGDGTTGAPQ